MSIRTRKIPCSDFTDWKTDLQTMGYHVLDNTPIPGDPGFCTLTFEADDHLPGPGTALLERAATAPQAALTDTQKQTAQAIVNVFETGNVRGDYGQVTLIAGDSGHLTFGRSQTTLASGNLARLVSAYCGTTGARFADRLRPYLHRLRDRDQALDDDGKLHNILRASADDMVMRVVQDQFFERTYWAPAASEAAALSITLPLGVATVYDSIVHGSWERMRRLTDANHGPVSSLGEQEWIRKYLATRRAWLASHPRADLRATVYRMDALLALATHENWSLDLPILVRGEEISALTMAARPPGCYDGPAVGSRALAVESPFARGLDVRLVQLGLSDASLQVKADGVFGGATAVAVRQYQQRNGLAATGVADLDLIHRLVPNV